LLFSANSFAQEEDYNFVVINVVHRTFSKKLKVNADLGDTKEQIKKSKEYLELLSNKKSVVSILNFMDVNDFELVEVW
jgi:hypothetical protein